MMSGNFGTDDKILAVLLCYSESELDKNAVHQGKYRGICGVNPYIWKPYLKDMDVHYNSIQGGFEVYKFYLDKTNSEYKALLEYKGAKNNEKVKEVVKKILKLKKQIKAKQLKTR